MAVISPVVIPLPKRPDYSKIVVWGPITESDTCAPIEESGYPDRSVQFVGDFGTSGAIQLQGSNCDYDGSNDTDYVVLTDPQGNNISKTAAALEQVTEVTFKVKPVISAGTDVSLYCYLFIHRSDGR